MINLLRVLIVIYGGFVIGIGTPIMWERRRLMRILRLDHAMKSAILLTVVNILVLVFVSAEVLSRWDHPLSWRTPMAVIIFTLKAFMLWEVRLDTLYQGLYRGLPIDRRSHDRRSGERRSQP